MEVKVFLLKEVRAAAAGLKLFLENKCETQREILDVCAELSRKTVTARHVQPAMTVFFLPAPRQQNPCSV